MLSYIFTTLISIVAGYCLAQYQKTKEEEKPKKNTLHKTLSKLRKTPNDVWSTPVTVVEEQIKDTQVMALKWCCYDLGECRELTWVDPFRHTGRYYDRFPENNKKEWAEITEGKCALEMDYEDKVVCSNPPYSIITKLLKKMTDDGAAVISLLILNMHLTAPRLAKMEEAGYKLLSIKFININGWWSAARCIWVHDNYEEGSYGDGGLDQYTEIKTGYKKGGKWD